MLFRSGQAVPAETSQVHQVDILNVRSFLEVLDQPSKRRRFKFNPVFFIHNGPLTLFARLNHHLRQMVTQFIVAPDPKWTAIR
mgnify:CR=1 FL=1